MKLFKGETLSNGIGLGRVLLLSRAPFACLNAGEKQRTPGGAEGETVSPEHDRDKEKERLEKAILLAEDRLDRLSAKENAGEEVRSILFAEKMILGDKETKNEILKLIEEGKDAADAVRSVSSRYVRAFLESDDLLLKGRVADVEDTCTLVTGFLEESEGGDDKAGEEAQSAQKMPEAPFIIIADSLTPTEITEYLCDSLKGIVVHNGSYLSHTAIIARAHEVPMLLVKDADLAEVQGCDAIIDSGQGSFFTEPDMDITAFYRRRAEKSVIPPPKKELEPVGIRIYSNITGFEDAKKAYDGNSAGIGLFRTEFLYMGREDPPSEEESLDIYRRVLELFQEKPVLVRTFDLGGDKEARFLRDREELKNLRGIRLAIREQELLITQFRALMRANIYGNLRVMIPLVSGKTDVLNTKALIRAAKRSLEKDGLLYRDFPLGIMVETVSAVQVIDELAGMSGFFSIGTNDLRAEISGKDRYKDTFMWEEHLNEQLTEMVNEIVAAAKNAGITVGICGETEGLHTESLGIDYISR